MENKLFSGIFFIVLFTAVTIIISLFTAFVWRNSIVIFLVSVVITYFLFRKFIFDVEVPKIVYILSLIVFLLAVHPLLFLHPFFNSSADPAPTIATVLITDTIPPDYSPYSTLAFTYQLGFPLFARLFVDFFPAIPPYLITWALAGLFSAFQLLFLYLFTSVFLRSKRAGIFASFLFVGTKVLFQNMYFGEYTWIMGTTFFFVAFGLFYQKNKLMYIFFPALIITHPGVAFYSFLFLILYTLFFRSVWRDSLKLAASSVLAIPSLIVTYAIAVNNVVSGSSTVILDTTALKILFSALPLWIGAVPFLVLIAAILHHLWKKKPFERTEVFLLVLLIVGILLLGIFASGVSTVMGSKIVEIITIASVLLGSSWLAKNIPKKHIPLALILILVFSLSFFFSSGELTKGRLGSKITQEEAAFSLKFKEFDPSLKKTLFLSKGSPKMAEFSNKIPYDVRTGHFISVVGHITVKNEVWEDIISKREKRKEIFENKCTECLKDIDVDYIIVNKEEFPLLENPVFEYGNFLVYNVY